MNSHRAPLDRVHSSKLFVIYLVIVLGGFMSLQKSLLSIALLFIVSYSAALLGQAITGTVVGTIQDPTGALVQSS